MPVIKLYPHGYTTGTPPTVNNHKRAKRGDVGGWSASSTRSNTRFLYSIRETELTGFGFAYTLTLKDCPPSHEEWHRIRDAFFKRLRRLGMVRAHWVTEWQRRGVPHLHCAVWFESPKINSDPLFHWWKLTKQFGSSLRGQHWSDITDSVGWFKYLSKHASRGLSHYQRSPENVPDGWKKTGRMWGYLGDWPRDAPLEFHVPNETYFPLRRIIRGLCKSDARASGDVRRIKHTRAMLTCHNKDLSQVRGISEWGKQDHMIPVMIFLASQGYEIEH